MDNKNSLHTNSKDVRQLKIGDKNYKKRIDLYLADKFPEFSRGQIQKGIDSGLVLLNKNRPKSSVRLKAGDEILFEKIKLFKLIKPKKIEGEDLPLKILFEDKNILAIDKPAGMVVHPAVGNQNQTLLNAVLNYDKKISKAFDKNYPTSELRPGIVHRLDKDTSGVILIAKNSETLKYLVSEFKNKRIKKTYLALVLGFLPKKGKIENYLSKDFRKRKTTINTEEKGKIAISIFRSIKYFYAEKNLYNFTLAEIEIITGRTHQIRVQMKDLGYPIIGDQIYKTKMSLSASKFIGVKRQLLHAKEVKFHLPKSNKITSISSGLTFDFDKVVGKLKTIDHIS